VLHGATYPLVLSDTFAVGLIVDNQLSLIVGFDRNNNRSPYNFYVEGNTNKWRQSTLPGTMIINPVMGKVLPGNLTPVKEIKLPKYEVKIYPNPTKDKLFIEGIKEKSTIEIYDTNGSLQTKTILTQSDFIDVRELPTGVYVIHLTNLSTQQIGTAKFIKSE
jgi:hypothetical protein